MFQQIVQADALIEAERMRGASGLEQAKVTAGAKAKGDKEDNNLKLTDQIKYGETMLGEGEAGKFIKGLDERKRGALAAMTTEFNNPSTTPERRAELSAQWEMLQGNTRSQDYADTTMLLQGAKDAAAETTNIGQGAKYGLGAALLGGVGSALALRKGNLSAAKKLGTGAATALFSGGLGGVGGYTFGGGSEGVDENSDLYDIENMTLSKDGTTLSNGKQNIPMELLTPQQQRYFLQKMQGR